MKANRYQLGYWTISLTVVITLLLWIGSRFYYQEFYSDPFMYVAKIGSLPSTILMCWAFLLSTRFTFVEWLFGGLDKVYKAHALIGKISFTLIFLHPIFLAMHRMPDVRAYASYLWFSPDWVRHTGIIALCLFSLHVALSIWVNIAYHRWKLTHNFFGLVLLIVIIHVVLADGDITRYPLLRAWFVTWLAVGVLSYLYIRVLYRFFGPLYLYRVSQACASGDILEVHLAPANPRRFMKHLPAQFAYVAFESPAISSEPHPYTVSSPPSNHELRLSVKELGDYTSQLQDLRDGDRAWVWGPYGHFSDYFFAHPEMESVFIAGGIGITPFLSILEDRLFQQHDRRRTYLFYSVLNQSDAYYHQKILDLHLNVEQVEYVPWFSDDRGFLSAEELAKHTGSLDNKSYFICGPKPMMDGLTEQLTTAGVPSERIFSEDFSLV